MIFRESLERYFYTAQQILQELNPQGYAGGYSILKEFDRWVRPVRKPAFLRLEFAPGEYAPGSMEAAAAPSPSAPPNGT